MKSGKETHYGELPSTVIIFITQEDVFGRDLAKYTFTEQCEEIPELKLEDGTSKIFLNMKSKNGRSEEWGKVKLIETWLRLCYIKCNETMGNKILLTFSA